MYEMEIHLVIDMMEIESMKDDFNLFFFFHLMEDTFRMLFLL